MSSDSTSIMDLPTDPAGGGSIGGNVSLLANEKIATNQSGLGQMGVSLDQTTIQQIVSGLQQASSTGATQLPSRDIPRNTEGIMQDPQIQQNYLSERLRSDEVPTMIYLVRHGETVLTPMRKFSGTGPLNPELTEKGLSQAAAVAKEIAKLKPEVIVASPLARTTQTAQAISVATGIEINFDEIGYELAFGDWDGLSFEEVKEKSPDEYQAWLNSSSYAPGGGESYDQAGVRIESALQKIAAEYPGQRVVVVTHNGVIKLVAQIVTGAPTEAVFHIDAAPCSITSISIWPSDGLRALRSLNETGHFRA